MSFIEGLDRRQAALLLPCLDDYIAPEALVRLVDVFVANLDLADPTLPTICRSPVSRPM